VGHLAMATRPRITYREFRTRFLHKYASGWLVFGVHQPGDSTMGERAMPEESTTLSTLMLDVHDLAAVISDVGLDAFLDEMIDDLRSNIASFDPAIVEHQIRAGFNYVSPEEGLVEWMPTMVARDVVSVKTVGYHAHNPTHRGLPSVLATTALYDTTTGRLIAMCEATLLTAVRTGAASAVMTDLCATRGPITLGVVGCGAQAVTQIHAISRVRDVARLVVTDTDASVANSLADRLPAGHQARSRQCDDLCGVRRVLRRVVHVYFGTDWRGTRSRPQRCPVQPAHQSGWGRLPWQDRAPHGLPSVCRRSPRRGGAVHDRGRIPAPRTR